MIYGISLLKDNDYIIKSTGRIYFPKIYLLIRNLVKKHDFIADSRRFNFLKWKKNYVLSNLFIFNVKWYKENLYDKKESMTKLKITHFETLLYFLLKDQQSINNNIMLRFPFNVNPVGIGAHWGVNYQSSKKRIEYLIRGIFRIIFPQIWI
jgi:hypothetical protein